MVGKKGKITGFKEKTEMADGGVGGKEFSVKGGVLGFGRGKLLEEKGKGRPGTTETFLENSTHMRVRCVRAREMAAPGTG